MLVDKVSALVHIIVNNCYETLHQRWLMLHFDWPHVFGIVTKT